MVVGLRYFSGWKFCQSSLCPTSFFQGKFGEIEIQIVGIDMRIEKERTLLFGILEPKISV